MQKTFQADFLHIHCFCHGRRAPNIAPDEMQQIMSSNKLCCLLFVSALFTFMMGKQCMCISQNRHAHVEKYRSQSQLTLKIHNCFMIYLF